MPSVRVRRVRGARARRRLVDHLEDHEPVATQALANVLDLGLGPFSCRAWLVSSGGAVGATVVATRICFDRWEAFVSVSDPACAAAAARTLDRSPAVVVTGAEEQLAPVLPHVGRLRYARRARFGSRPLGAPPAPDARTRWATPADVEELTDLYTFYGIGLATTRRDLRRIVRRTIAVRHLAVCELDGRLVGASALTALTRRFAVGDDQVVHPDLRGRGLSKLLTARIEALTAAYDAPLCGVIYPTNPTSVPADMAFDTPWVYGVLRDRPAVKGWGRLKGLVHRIGALPEVDQPMYHSFDLLPFGTERDELAPR